MKKTVVILLILCLALAAAACGQPAGQKSYSLAKSDTVGQAVQFSGDFMPFADYYTGLETEGYDIHDISLKDNQWNVYYDYAPDLSDSETVSAALKWSVPDSITVKDGKISFTVSLEGQGTLLINDEQASPGIYGDADIFTSAKPRLRTTETDYNNDLVKQDFTDTILTYDPEGDDRQISSQTFEFDDSPDDKTLIIIVYAAINRHYVRQIYYYDRP